MMLFLSHVLYMYVMVHCTLCTSFWVKIKKKKIKNKQNDNKELLVNSTVRLFEAVFICQTHFKGIIPLQ